MIAARQPERSTPVLLPEFEADRAAELDELRFGEVRVEAGPEVVVGSGGVPGDRVRPPQGEPLTLVEAGEVRDLGVLGEVADFARFDERERLALRWAHAIAWDSSVADDDLWAGLHARFSEPELVELGCAIGFELGQQHWRRTVGLPRRDHDGTS